MLTSSEDKTVKIWFVNNCAFEKQLDGHTDTVTSAVFSPDGKRVLTTSSDKSAVIWMLDTGGKEKCLTQHRS